MSENVIAAIPAFNAGQELVDLTSQLIRQEFKDIYILDDASSDGSVETAAKLFPTIHILRHAENRGPAANRNQILKAVKDGVILFVDADMEITSPDIAFTVSRAMAESDAGLLGGYIMNKQGTAMGWNYGFEMDPRRDTWFSLVTAALNRNDISDDYRQDLLQDLHSKGCDYNWVSDTDFALKKRQADWVAEGLFAVRADVFKEVGGYDESMSYHEGQDLARRIRDSGRHIWFDPAFSARHLEVDTRSSSGPRDFRENQYYFFQKHWGMSRPIFDRLYS